MNLKILWMYHDLMDLYGDKGNAEVLRRRAEKRGIEVQLDTCTIGEEKNIDEYDLFFLGGGADKEQNLIFADLLQRKQSIQTAMDHKTAFLLICGGYQLFGQYYKDQDGNVIEGLKFFDYYTVAGNRDERCIGNIAVETTMETAVAASKPQEPEASTPPVFILFRFFSLPLHLLLPFPFFLFPQAVFIYLIYTFTIIN